MKESESRRLFIGGSQDGKFLILPKEDKEYFVETYERRAESWESVLLSESKVEKYEAMPFRGENTTFVVMALCCLSGDDILEKLIENYRPQG